jgi:hypothetical protein
MLFLSSSPEEKEQTEQTSMACLLAPVAAVLIVNHRESKDKIMVRLLLLNVISVGWPFLQWAAKSFFFCFLAFFGYHNMMCFAFLSNQLFKLPHLSI